MIKMISNLLPAQFFSALGGQVFGGHRIHWQGVVSSHCLHSLRLLHGIPGRVFQSLTHGCHSSQRFGWLGLRHYSN
jgi:hypothetical protein